MSDDDNLKALIAHYLAANYPSVLPSFLQASGTTTPDLRSPPVPDLRTLVSDARSAELAAQLERTRLDAPQTGVVSLEELVKQPLPADDALTRVDRQFDDITPANLVAVVAARVPRRTFDTASATYAVTRERVVICAGADKVVRVVDFDTGHVEALLEPHKAPVLCLAVHPTNPRYLASGAMDGTTVLSDLVTNTSLQTLPNAKFVVRVAFSHDGRWLAAASYDKSVSLYEATTSPHHTRTGDDDADAWIDALDDNDEPDSAGEPTLRYELRHRVQTTGNPEALLFHPRSTWLMYTQRGSPVLHYLGLPPAPGSSEDNSAQEAWTWPTREKSFNAHALDSHVSFAVLDLALHPSGRIIACITGDHAGTGAERVLLYGVEPDETDRLACLWTGSEPDAFVLPRVAFLPSGRGIIATAASGELTLLSLTGEVRSRLKVHAARRGVGGTSDVVRDIAIVDLDDQKEHAGSADVGGKEHGWEVVSVGYDRTVKITLGLRQAAQPMA